ncbi:MAG: tyrosine-type recombinase/integrase [Bacteroidales bacterium]|nr:tyrosine-type recombinase/integrase [Bacteroidales bacterium]MDD2771981.1 tyrosine-type recombinase/integrase [Bacteroidales bacterium]MDD3556187.1 tyrosine-type recombinase/integrase [Proteiniphilum sp.]MDD3978979.1 tyrosine-type recombinase/integrase [Proteiniphilum sp.]
MRKIEGKSTDNPKLIKKELKNGTYSLYLEYYWGYSKSYDDENDTEIIRKDRRKEALQLYLLKNPRTPIERQTNKETLELAKKIRFEREQQLKDTKTGYRLNTSKKVNIIDCMDAYYADYTKKDIRMVKGAINRFKDFIAIEYPECKIRIFPEQLNKDLMIKFVEYLQSRGHGSGAFTYYKRFKKIVRHLVEKNYLPKNPCQGVVCKTDEESLKKDILSVDEMKKLIETTYPQQNKDVRRAFIFCLYTGIRYCDVKDLRYGNVDFYNKLLTFNQKKTEGHSSKSWVTIPLNDGLLSLVGNPEINEDGRQIDTNLFNLPSQTMCLKSVKKWVKRAGIQKHITWHCARHSFAVNILNNGANIKTVASLLGHSGLEHTEKYTRAVDELKQKAIDSLPELV